MPRQKKEAAAGRSSARPESAETVQSTARPPVRWLPAPRKRPILLAILAVVYVLWLLALAWMAASAR